jgi:hypothetical protein
VDNARGSRRSGDRDKFPRSEPLSRSRTNFQTIRDGSPFAAILSTLRAKQRSAARPHDIA